MSKERLDYVIDLGGSTVNPGELDAAFLKDFARFCGELCAKGRKFAVVVGGGFITRLYQEFLRSHFHPTDDDLDMIGIRPTKLNAELVRIILKGYAYPRILESPEEFLDEAEKYHIFVFSGWKPGWSTDYVSVLVAKRFGVKTILCLSNIRGVYPIENDRLNPQKIIPRLRWDEYAAMIDRKWSPGAKMPFDPVATGEAKANGMAVAVLQGKDLANVKHYLENKPFVGTVIS